MSFGAPAGEFSPSSAASHSRLARSGRSPDSDASQRSSSLLSSDCLFVVKVRFRLMLYKTVVVTYVFFTYSISNCVEKRWRFLH